MTTINFQLEVPADKLSHVSDLFKELQFQLTGQTPEAPVNTLQYGRMTNAEFMQLVVTMRDAHAGRTIKEAYELSEAVHYKYFKKNMYADYETFTTSWGRFQNKKINRLT